MKNSVRFFSLILLSVISISSCKKEPDAGFPDDNIYALRSITYKGETTNKFLYNPNGKIAEAQSLYYCERYTYDDNNRMVKFEETSSSETNQSNELMTSQNSTFTWNHIYEYDQDGVLKYIKLYQKDKYDSVFRYWSTASLEYENGNIVRMNSLNAAGDSIIQFIAYEYDDNRNLLNEKHYSNIFIDGPGPELQYEVSYKYDSKNNPFIICKGRAIPGLYTNTNNMLESNSIFYNVTPGSNNYSTRTEAYEYNDKGFPVKVIIGSTVYEYVYD